MNLPNDHIVKSYDEEQQRLVAEIVRMGDGRRPARSVDGRDREARNAAIASSPTTRRSMRWNSRSATT